MAEHSDLTDRANALRRLLATGDSSAARATLAGLVADLDRHVRREESGIFRAVRNSGEYGDEVDGLESEHRGLDAALAALDPTSPDFPDAVQGLLDDLAEHIEREELGIFPVSVVTLGSHGWQLVEQAHDALPTFLEAAVAGS
jgi:hemerythrin-like domain-containing protein